MTKYLSIALDHPLLFGLFLRLFFASVLPYFFDNDSTGVRYTDIDYLVFTDAARYASQGLSPYLRHTYRYTPFLAEILAIGEHFGPTVSKYFGRYMFCGADALCGYIIMNEYERSSVGGFTGHKVQSSVRWKGLMWWMLNPLPINICTRGSAEAFVVLLPVLMSVKIALRPDFLPFTKNLDHHRSVLYRACISGILLGLSIHSKIYPIIYSISFMAHFSREQGCTELWPSNNIPQKKFPFTEPWKMWYLVFTWMRRLTLSAPLIFLFSAFLTFSFLTGFAVLFYGRVALDEAFLYHFSRVDHRHNYSMFWYWIYLSRANVAKLSVNADTLSLVQGGGLGVFGKLLMIPQLVLLTFCSIGVASLDLSFTLFLQTFLFVALNKVITAQYFTWYLCLLPLCANRIMWSTKRMIISYLFLGIAFIFWLVAAYCLEMRGMAIFFELWVCSVVFFAANSFLFCSIIESYHIRSGQQNFITKRK